MSSYFNLEQLEHLLAMGFNFCCNPLSPRRRLTTRIWLGAIITFTLSTTGFMLGCVCTDQWEITTFDYTTINESIYNASLSDGNPALASTNPDDRCTFTHARQFGQGLLLITGARRRSSWTDPMDFAAAQNRSSIANQLTTTSYDRTTDNSNLPPPCQGRMEYKNISLVFRQFGSAFRLCLDVDESLWPNVSRICSPLEIERCAYYNPNTVKKPFCCKKCLYSTEEVQELDENGNTTFEPIFTVIGFLIVCLVVLCVCHVLAVIAIWKRLVPVVMFTGILFLVSGTFMAFCLAAHQYKVSIMNARGRSLPHLTHEMAMNSYTKMGWSIDSGWMGFAFSVLTGILWIRFSFHLASETTYNKIRPTMSMLNGRSGMGGGNGGGIAFSRGTSVPAAAVAPLAPAGPVVPLHHSGAHSGSTTLDTNGVGPPLQANGGGSLVPKTVRWASSPGKDTTSTAPNSRPDSGGQLLLQNDHHHQSNQTGYGSAANGNTPIAHSASKESLKLPMMVEDAV